MSTGRTRLDEILGGLSGRGAAAGVLGVEARKVLTMTSPEVPEAPEAEKLVTVAMACGVWFSGISLEAKFYRQEMSSISISSSSPSLLALTFLKKGDLEWGRTIPLELLESEEIPLLPPKPSSEGGAEGSAA